MVGDESLWQYFAKFAEVVPRIVASPLKTDVDSQPRFLGVQFQPITNTQQRKLFFHVEADRIENTRAVVKAILHLKRNG